MKHLTETELKEKLQSTETKLATRVTEFIGEIGDFQYFLKQGIAKQIYSMTTIEHTGNKPTLREMEEIMFNITVLNEVFDLLGTREYLERELYKDIQEHL